jgi:iron complex outermembrane receptor protein
MVAVRAAVLLLVFASNVFGQTVVFSGRATDSQGAAVTGAAVSLRSATTGAEASSRTAMDGTFQFTAIPPGRYLLSVVATGFARFDREVTLDAGTKDFLAVLEIAPLVEDVTVEGQAVAPRPTTRIDVPLRDVPITVNAVPSQVIREQGVNDLVSALRNVSGLNPYTNYGVYEYYMLRGFGFGNSVQLVDGMKNEGNRINSQLANIETVEVLKGPASALYGNEAIGGTINLIRKKPSAQRTYEFSTAAGRWGTYRGTAGATGRLGSDAVLYRIDVGGDRSDGWRHNAYKKLNVTPAVYWRIDERDQLNFHYTFNRDRFATDGGIPLLGADNGAPTASTTFPDVPRDRRYNTPQDFALSFDHNFQVAYTRTLGNRFGFRNTLSYRHFDDEYFSAELLWATTPTSVRREFFYFKHHRRPVTNVAELTGSFNLGIEHTLLAGWEGQRYYNFSHRSAAASSVTTPIDLFNPVETHVDRAFPITRIDYFTNNTNAFYVQDHLALASNLKVLLGGRLDIFRRYSHNDPVNDGVQTLGPEVRNEKNPFTGRVGVVYQPVQALDLYGSFANSYKPVLSVPIDGRNLEPETGNQYEVGQRIHLLNDRVQINAATYQIEKRNVTFSRPGGIFEQAGKQRSRGFELDLTAAPTLQWRVNAGYGYTDAKYLDYLVSPTRDLTGKFVRYATPHIVNVWSAYDWSAGFGVSGGVRYLSRSFADDTNLVSLPGYAVADLALRYRRGVAEYAMNVTNLFNTEYFVSALYDTQLYPGQPTAVTASVRLRLR